MAKAFWFVSSRGTASNSGLPQLDPPYAQPWWHEWNAKVQMPGLRLRGKPALGFCLQHKISTAFSTVYQLATILRSDDARKYNKNQKVFLNHHFTQQSIERGYKVWLTVIFIHLMDFSTLQLGSIPTGRRLFSLVKIINNSYAAVSPICGSSADCLDLLTSLVVGFQLKWRIHYFMLLIILQRMTLKPFSVK